MIRSTHLLPILAVSLSCAAATPAARAENPLERLHRHLAGKIFGDQQRRDDHCDKQRKSKERDCDRRHENPFRTDVSGWYPNYRPEYDQRIYEPREPRYSQDYAEVRYVQPARSLEIEVQLALQRSGYYLGQIDGDVGSGTRAAIRHFQYDHNLHPSGRIDRELLIALRL